MQTKEQKKKLVKELVEKLKDSKATVFSDYKGLSVKDMTALRAELREKGVSMQVLKKTLLTIALKDAGVELDATKFEGQIAVAVSPNDEVDAAKIIAKMAKANENLKIAGGLLGKNILSEEEVQALAKLPSKEELLAKLVGTLKGPLSGLHNALSGNLRGLVQVLGAVRDSKES